MKTITRIATLLILAMMASFGKAQTLTIYAGSSTVVTAVNNLSLSSPSYSLEPGAITSPNATFAVSPASTVIYTLYVTGTNSNSAVQTTSNLVTVIVMPQPSVVCAGSSSVVTAVNSLSLSSPSYSLNPGGIISSNPTFTITPASTVIYTLYVTGTNSNSAVQTTSNLVTVSVASVPIISLTPVSQNIGCGPGLVVTATCVAIAPSNNVTHNWYCSASPFPLSSSGQVSTYPMGGAGIYTCVVVDNLTGCIATKTAQVISTAGTYPTFDLASVTNFSLGCGTQSLSNIIITNAQVSPNGGAVSYTVLSPAFTGTTYGFTTTTTYLLSSPGIYTVIVKANNNACETRVPVSITQNTISPAITLPAFQNTLSCTNPTVLVQAAPNSILQYNFVPMTIQASSIIISSNPAVPTQSLLTTLTVVATDINNACQSTTTIPVYQNVYLPNAAITAPSPSSCQDTIVLTNTSTSGILSGTFPTVSPVVGLLWRGPSPQPTASLSSTYLAQTSGIYTMTAMDMNNGCIKTATYNAILKPVAAFVHTITVGVAVFNDVSTGTNTNTTYFWDFGDGNTSTWQNPTHTYTNGGAHLVKFKIMDSQTFCSDSVIQSITISGVPCAANSNFSMVPTSTAQVWNVVPSYPWNVTAASWNWGDSSVSNTLYASHQYSAAGMYNICLSVTVSCGTTSTTCTSYSVYRVSQQAMIIKVNVIAPGLIAGLTPAEAGELLSWNILPNPNSGEFNLNLENIKIETVRIVISDLTGRVVYDQPVKPNSTAPVQSGNLLPGMYLVTLESNGLKATKRMIVNR